MEAAVGRQPGLPDVSSLRLRESRLCDVARIHVPSDQEAQGPQPRESVQSARSVRHRVRPERAPPASVDRATGVHRREPHRLRPRGLLPGNRVLVRVGRRGRADQTSEAGNRGEDHATSAHGPFPSPGGTGAGTEGQRLDLDLDLNETVHLLDHRSRSGRRVPPAGAREFTPSAAG